MKGAQRWSPRRAGWMVAAAALLAVACTPPWSVPPPGDIVIASELPTSGAETSNGLPIQNGIEYAISTQGKIRGFKLVFRPYDDAVNGIHNPDRGAANVTDMVSDPKVLGMIGPENSNVAVAEIPVANRGGLAMLSSSNTNECLTQSQVYCAKQPGELRPTRINNYFRIAAADTFQGPAMAFYSIQVLKLKNLAVWSDGQTFGKNVADQFTKEFERRGGKVVYRQDIPDAAKPPPYDFKPFLRAARAAGAEAIYAGATSATKGCVARAQSKGILDVPYLGPDGIDNDQCIKDAGDQAGDKMFSTVAAADAIQNQDPAARAVVSGYKAKYPKDTDIAGYTFPSYDAASIMIDAIGRAIDTNGGRMPSRKQVVDALASTKNFRGITGTYSLDANGDPTTPVMAFFQIQAKDGTLRWVFQKQISLGGQ